MTTQTENRLVRILSERRDAGRKTLLPFITAGYPSLDATVALLKTFESRGAKVCELGIPFSDPVADGPVIQASYTDCLERGVNTAGIFEAVARYRADGGQMALIAMVSYSIVFRRTPEHFMAAAAKAGFDGLIVPDLPLEEAHEFETAAAGHGLANVMLIAPNTPADRRMEIARHSRGFIYFISVAGITGERTQLPAETIDAVGELRQHTDTPVCVGFGVSTPEMVKIVCEVADGAIVGSAIVHRITDHREEPVEQMAEKVGDFVAALLAPL